MTRPSWIGQTLGNRYRIDDILGQGGMSAVYKAYDPNLKRVVAIKMIHAHLAEDPKFMVRFEEEATAVAQLRHPNIVQVFDFNHDGDLYYMVQEFVAGETLQERLRRLNKANRRMPLDEAIGYIINICDAAGYAHNRGLIHRDIKPANIMIDIHGQAILMDFGIVKITGGEKHTATGAVVGTALYLPPEAIRGETSDPRSDQYSLGVTLFEAVGGRPPYEADSAMTLMMMHLNDPLPDLRQLRPDVPPALVTVIEKALAKSREARYPSMAEFALALRNALAMLNNVEPALTVADQPAQEISAPISPLISPSPEPALASAKITITEATSLPYTATNTIQDQVIPEPITNPQGAEDSQVAAPARSRSRPVIWAGIAGVVTLAVLGLIFLLRGMGGSPTIPDELTATVTPTSIQAAQPALVITESSPTSTLTRTPTITPILPSTATPTITQSPTPTIPLGMPFSRINAITVNEKGAYVVDYETFEFTEVLPGQHVHFYFNTVPQEQAGNPGQGPWKLYGGPRPFEGYRPIDRPEGATQMCIRVANPNHSIQMDSGNCYFLPDVNVVVPVFDEACLAGPGTAYPTLGQLSAGQVLLASGISADEAWWIVENPQDPAQACWLQRSRSDFSGDLSTLPLVDIPPLPQGSAADLSVEINQITLDDQGRYVVEFTPSGFSPALPGTHMHFFFDIFAADQFANTGGNRLMYGGASPFTGYTQASRPSGASQICVLVANPDHSVIPDSGNCYQLP